MTTPAVLSLSFEQLVAAIGQVHAEMTAQASWAVNTSLTLIGCYIAEYELNGFDRAAYGDKVLSELARRLQTLATAIAASSMTIFDSTEPIRRLCGHCRHNCVLCG